MKSIDLTTIHHIHFVGIKGVGMTALAVWAIEKGCRVTGSDIEEEFPTKETLQAIGVIPLKGFSKDQITNDIDLVVVTGAHGGKTNVEAKEAMQKNIPTVMQGEALGIFSRDKKVIAVAGSHGKTTTTALIAHILTKAGYDPSYIVGCGGIAGLGLPAHAGKGDYFVIEADEYINCPNTDKTPKFLFLQQSISVVTNIEFDHPDAYENLDAVEKSFEKFLNHTSSDGISVICTDNSSVTTVAKELISKKISYGISTNAEYRPEKIKNIDGKTTFTLVDGERNIADFTLKIPGIHNVLNTIASSIVAHHIGISWEKIADYSERFRGTKRRFELIASYNTIDLYDDYAHHPTEIEATLQAARSWFPKRRIIAIFQPHTYSRTKALFDEFAQAFRDADIVVIASIYASAREKVDMKVSSKALVEEMKRYQKEVWYKPAREDVVHYIEAEKRPGDVIITLGAGDIYNWLSSLSSAIHHD